VPKISRGTLATAVSRRALSMLSAILQVFRCVRPLVAPGCQSSGAKGWPEVLAGGPGVQRYSRARGPGEDETFCLNRYKIVRVQGENSMNYDFIHISVKLWRSNSNSD